MQKLISVIIPFYKVEKYIEKCIGSVKNQTYTNFECLLIDDESPDSSFKLAQKAILDDPRFSIIRQNNKGLGGARNTGIEHAKGEYIFFLDSDDWILPHCLETLYSAIHRDNSEIAICAYNAVSESGEVNYTFSQFEAGTYTDKSFILNQFLYYPTAWNKLYKKSLWENIRYPEKMYYEDLATTYKLVNKISKITAIDDCLYQYLQRAGSIMTSYSPKNVEDRFTVFAQIEQNLSQNVHITSEHSTILGKIYLSQLVYMSLNNIALSRLPFSEKRQILAELKQRFDKKYFNSLILNNVKNELSKAEFWITKLYFYSTEMAISACLLKEKIKSLRA